MTELAAAGIAASADAPALAAAKARATRAAKQAGHGEAQSDRHAFWRDRATARGFAPEQVVEAALRAGREPVEGSKQSLAVESGDPQPCP